VVHLDVSPIVIESGGCGASLESRGGAVVPLSQEGMELVPESGGRGGFL